MTKSFCLVLTLTLLPACSKKTFQGGTKTDTATPKKAEPAPPSPPPSPQGPVEEFAKLNGARWEMPCLKPEGDRGCETVRTVDRTVEMGGDASKTYLVKLRFRGVVEPMLYKGGSVSTVDPHFYVGGSPDNEAYNIYELKVEKPAKSYYLNADSKVDSQVFAIDYTAEIEIAGKSKVTLFADNQNGSSIANKDGVTVKDITTSDEIKSGQFVQMDVVSVKPK